MFDHNTTTREGSLTDSDYSPNGVVDSGIVLPVGSEKEIVAQRHSPGPAQEDDNLCMADCVTTKQEESDIYMPPTTIISKKEPDEPSKSSGEITTAFSFLSYPQCGLYRRAFAQGYIDSGFYDMTLTNAFII